MSLNFHNKFIQFTLTNMLHFDLKIHPSVKWTNCRSIPLHNLVSTHHHIHIWHMANNMVVEAVKSKTISQFQVLHMSYPGLKQNNLSEDKIEKLP